jgi:hypothetical protein
MTKYEAFLGGMGQIPNLESPIPAFTLKVMHPGMMKERSKVPAQGKSSYREARGWAASPASLPLMMFLRWALQPAVQSDGGAGGEH